MHGYPLASVYLAQGDRLRCLAVGAYGQAFDGIPPGCGLIGRAFADGVAARLHAPAGAGCMEAAEGVLDELALPRVHGGSCVGVLNVESRQAMPDADVDDLAQAAQVLAVALSADSGPPVESASWPRRARRRRPCARCVTASSHRRSPVSRPAAAAG